MGDTNEVTVEVRCTAADLSGALHLLHAQARQWFGHPDYMLEITEAYVIQQLNDSHGSPTGRYEFRVTAQATWTAPGGTVL